jgi:outer membrane protein OmpA-like peptidoglycan-associated protein
MYSEPTPSMTTVETVETPEEAAARQFRQAVNDNTPVFFIANLDVWLAGEENKLDKILTGMKGLKKVELTVTGHTADAGMPNAQMNLSTERAQAVKNFLLENPGTTELTITAVGKGATEPAIKDVPLNEQQVNRRVEITVESAE